jgi:hypothetical protein
MTEDSTRSSAGLKCCPRCNVKSPLDHFGISRARKDGRNIYCKRCNRDRTNASRQSARERQEKQKGARISPMATGRTNVNGARAESVDRFELSCQSLPRAAACLSPVERVRDAIRSGPKTQKEILEETKLSKDEIGDALADLLLWLHEVGTHSVGDTRLYFLKVERDGESENETQNGRRSDFDSDVSSFSSLPFFVRGKAASAG